MKKKLRIAEVAPLWYTIPPKKYGGVEKIISSIADGLVKRGHEVTLFAAPGSKIKNGKLVSIVARPRREAGTLWDNKYWDLMNLAEVARLTNAGNFDIIHNHIDLAQVFFSGFDGIPIITTLHSGVYYNEDASDYYRTRYDLLKMKRGLLNVVFISRAMKRLVGFKFKNSRVIYNGIDTEKFRYNPKPDDYLLWVGRIEKKKGIENAIAAAAKTGMPLFIAGRIDEISKKYFSEKIKPKLSKKIRYLGELNETRLVKIYRKAKALLFPIEWEEPFGLVMTESMACGTPVIAFNRGSVPEVIVDGKTGFIVDTVEEVAAAVKKIGMINRQDCRKHVEKNFSVKRMVDEYEKAFLKLTSGSSLR